MQKKVDTVVRINGIPLAKLLPRGAQTEVAKKHKVKRPYIGAILNGLRSDESILDDLLSKALEVQEDRELRKKSLKEKLEKLQQIVTPTI